MERITVCIDDEKLYTFKEGDYNRLRLQDIEDMLLLVQGKLTNLNIEERLALGVSLRMFIRSIVIRRRVKDLQLGIESYQKKLNLTKSDTLMCIDELHKFSDGTLNDVRSVLDDILKFDTSAGNPVKEILLKLNLPYHRILKDGGEGTWF
ncbi:hypothetical protein Tco_1418695 [Tanacetum coccineum]